MHKVLAKYFVFVPGQMLRGEHIIKYIHDLQKNEWLDRREIEASQWKKLIKLINHAALYSPYYEKLFKKHNIDIHCKDDLLQFPQLKKGDIRLNQETMISTNTVSRFSRKITGGSTGQAVSILKDRKAMAYQDAAMWRALRWFGIDIGDRQARFWGVPIDSITKTKYQFIDFFMNRVRLSAFNFDYESMRSFFNRLLRFKPKYFYGYVSMIKEFAEFCEDNNYDLNDLDIRAIVTTSETLYEKTREYLSRTFNCPVINDYGCGEVGPIAYSCPEGGFHLLSDNVFVEIITEQGKHAREGEKGEVVVTELNNYAMPLIRYNLEDIVEATDEKCTCGRGLPLIKKVNGRALDILCSTNGERIHGEYFNYIAEEIKKSELGLKQYQVIQKETNSLTVRIVKGNEYSKTIQTHFEQRIKERMGHNTKISFEFVDRIEREKSGKLRLVKCEISN